IAREYGFAGWPDLTAEVQKRLGPVLEWAASQAKVAIYNQDHERLRTLLAEYPALVSWRDESGETLLSSTTPYALDCSDPQHHALGAVRPRPGDRANLRPTSCLRDAHRRRHNGRTLDVGVPDPHGRIRNAAPARSKTCIAADSSRSRRAWRR